MDKASYPDTYLVWDLETSGLEKEDCKILEIGCMQVIAGTPSERMSWVLDHKIEIPAKIVELTGITPELVAEKGVEPVKAMRDFLSVLVKADAHLTHNGMRFDIEWLAYHMAKTLGWTVGQHRAFRDELRARAIDTAVFVKAGKIGATRRDGESFADFADRVMNTIAKGVKYNVGVCCEELGIDKAPFAQHRALGDVELTHLIYRKVLARS